MNKCFYMRKKFSNVNASIWRIYEVMNVHLLKSMKCALKMEFWADFRSWKMKIFYVFFGQMLAKMVFWCWPMLKNCQKWYLGASSYQELCQKLVLAKIWPKNTEFPVKQLFLPTWHFNFEKKDFASQTFSFTSRNPLTSLKLLAIFCITIKNHC